MAVDGRTLRSSIYKGSDGNCEFPCSYCSKEGRNVAAIKHCVDCNENFCSSCLKEHNKFSAMKGHGMLDKVKSPSETSTLLPKQKCTKHGGKVIDVYCPGHDTVCCSTCIAVEHSICNGISFIPDVAKKIGTSSELQQFESKISNLESRCMSMSKSKDTGTHTLKQNKSKLLGEIRDFRKKINDHFDKMERRLLDDADTKFKQKMTFIDDERDEINDILENLKQIEQRLQAAKHENEAEIFVLLKSERASLEKFLAIIDRKECKGTTIGLKLTVEKKVEKVLIEGCGIGEVEECFQNIVSSFYGEYDIKAKDDRKLCSITEICLCKGDIYLTDYHNKRLKKLDNHYKLSSCLSMHGTPAGVCNVDDKQLAVTLDMESKVQFVSCTEPMQLQASFHVGDCCRGIEYNKGLLFVCCGGDTTNNEGPGHLEVYNINGTLLRSIYDFAGQPRSFSVSPDGKYIFVPYFGESRLGIFGTYGEIVKECQYQELKFGSRICRLTSKLLCITGRNSDNIAVITNDGELQQLMLTKKDNISNPVAVRFDEMRSRLIVSAFKSGIFKVFHLDL